MQSDMENRQTLDNDEKANKNSYVHTQTQIASYTQILMKSNQWPALLYAGKWPQRNSNNFIVYNFENFALHVWSIPRKYKLKIDSSIALNNALFSTNYHAIYNSQSNCPVR